MAMRVLMLPQFSRYLLKQQRRAEAGAGAIGGVLINIEIFL
jgi:hypothetical protein